MKPGAVFLTDFGLAKATATGSRYTRTGQALGTPAYMSPEAARGEAAALTPATDVWALGCVFHELLAGRRAFEGDTPAAVIGAVLAGTPAALPDLPPPVADLVAICLQRDPRDRPPDAMAFRAECDRVLAGARPLRRARSRRGAPWPLAAAVAALAVVGVVAWAARPGEPPARPEPAPDADVERLATTGWELRHTDPACARAMLADAVARAPRRHEWRLRLGLLQWAERDDVPGAVDVWESVPRGSPAWTRACWLQGLAWCARSVETVDAADSERGLVAWRAAATGSGPEAGWARAGLALQAHRWDEARALLAVSPDWTASLLAGLVETSADAEGDAKAGIAALTHALETGVALAWAFGNRAILRQRTGDGPGAVADCTAMIQRRPEWPDAYHTRAKYRAPLGDVVGALADLDRTLELRPTDAGAYYNRGHLRAAQGRATEALEDFEAALRHSPDHVEARFARANRRRAVGDAEGAREDYDAALRVDPDHAGAHCNRGKLRLEAGDVEGARADLDAAVRLAADTPEPWFMRAALHAIEGELPEAEADIVRALAVAPADWHYRASAEHDLARVRAARGGR